MNDERLARRAAKGDRRAFEQIYRRYHQDLYRFSLTMLGNAADAEDALQNTMVKVLRALPGERRRIRLKPWLYRIARNEALEAIRRRRDTVELDADRAVAPVGATDTVATRERLRGLIADLQELPERQRAALVMREMGGLGFDQIAAAFETTPGAVRQLLYEARLGLRQMEEGREMTCEAAMRELSDGDGRVIRGRRLRGHLRGCASCRAFHEGIAERRGDFAAIAPLPLALSAGVLSGALSGAGSGAAGAGAGAGAGAAGAGAAGAGVGQAVATAAIVKSAATVAVVAVGATAVADRSGLIDVPTRGGGTPATENAASPPPATDPPAAAGARGPRSATSPGGERVRRDRGRPGKPKNPGQAQRQASRKPGQPTSNGRGKADSARGGSRASLPAASAHGQEKAAGRKAPQANPSPRTGPRSNPPAASRPAPPSRPAGARKRSLTPDKTPAAPLEPTKGRRDQPAEPKIKEAP